MCVRFLSLPKYLRQFGSLFLSEYLCLLSPLFLSEYLGLLSSLFLPKYLRLLSSLSSLSQYPWKPDHSPHRSAQRYLPGSHRYP